MDIFHLCRYIYLYSLTKHTYCKVFSYSHLCTAKCLQQGMVDIEHVYWDDTILLKMTYIITSWCSALLCRTAVWYIHSDFFLPQTGIWVIIIIIIIIIIIKEKFGSCTGKTLDRFTTKDSYTWNITHNTESTAVWSLKPERWGSPLVQEKYKEEKVCDKRRR